jgi:glycosyltransferase involved in cell wall biosynthesis
LPDEIVIYARGRFVRKDAGVCFYDNDGVYVESIADLFGNVHVVGRIVERHEPAWDYARHYTYRLSLPNVRPVFIGSWRRPTALVGNLFRVLPLLRRCGLMISMGPSWMSYLLALLAPARSRVVLYNGFEWRPSSIPETVAHDVERRALARADAILCTGAHLKQLYEDQYGRLPVRETAPLLRFPYQIEAAKNAVRKRRPGSEYRVLSVGHLLPRKRQEDLLHAVAELREKATGRISVDVVGYGRFHDFRTTHREVIEKLGSDLTFHGHVADLGQLEKLYRAADVMVVTSEAEGFPRTIYEAMMFGVPVISARLPGLTSVFDDGVDVLFYRSRDPVGLADQLRRLMEDDELAQRLRENNRHFIGRALSKTPRQQLIEILDDLSPAA